jgi:septum formation protein
MKSLLLGSNSPRRKELLAQLGFSFDVSVHPIDETLPSAVPLYQAAEYLAIEKNKVIAKKSSEIVLTADTVVINGGISLGKPSNAQEASEMIKRLSNGSHDVVTGVCISSPELLISFSCKTKVCFGSIPAADINYYISQFNPWDKAGAYGIQEWLGLAHIRSIEGSFYNVVGLPTERVYDVLTNIFGLLPLKK